MELLKVEKLCKVYGKGESEVRAVDGKIISDETNSSAGEADINEI